ESMTLTTPAREIDRERERGSDSLQREQVHMRATDCPLAIGHTPFCPVEFWSLAP
ncbi:hypothetical protein PanWU01x14_319200, partial [Parasponia andersonii]